MKSDYQEKLTSLSSHVSKTLLKWQGFKKRRNAFNRKLDGGIVQIISFQAGSYEPFAIDVPNMNYFPNSLYGKFTINLGIYIDDLQIFMHGKKPKDFVNEYDCQLRTRASHLVTSTDEWISIDKDFDKLSKETTNLIEKYALPFLDRFNSREKIEEYFKTEGTTLTNIPLAYLAIMCHKDGNNEASSSYMKKHIDSIVNHEGHKEYMFALAKKLGLDI